jgi:lipopolysaccharide transport system ATP-binding protein
VGALQGKEDPNSVIGMYNQEQIDGDDRFWALRDINFQVKQGDRVGIIGKKRGRQIHPSKIRPCYAPTKGNVRVKPYRKPS